MLDEPAMRRKDDKSTSFGKLASLHRHLPEVASCNKEDWLYFAAQNYNQSSAEEIVSIRRKLKKRIENLRFSEPPNRVIARKVLLDWPRSARNSFVIKNFANETKIQPERKA